jgi:uncharacterized membrane protein
MDEKRTEESAESTGAESTGKEGSGRARDRREFEEKLDGYAEKFSRAVSDGVKKLEDAFDKGKANLRDDMETKEESKRISGSPRMGLILVIVGILWLLFTMGVLRQPIFPILVIILGAYFLIRRR